MASGGNSIISEVLRRGSVPKYYCHGCKSRFGTNRSTSTSSETLSCPRCTSEFIEVLEEEEGRTVGASVLGASGSGGDTASPSNSSSPSKSKPSSADKDDTDSSSTAAMETNDPQPEPRLGPRRRTAASRTTGAGGQSSSSSGSGGAANPFASMFGGDQFVYVQRRPRPFAQLAYEHIDRLHERFAREREQREREQQQQQGRGAEGEDHDRPSSPPPRRPRPGVRPRDHTPDVDEDEEEQGGRGGGEGGGGGGSDEDGDSNRRSNLSITMDLPLLFASGRGGVSMGMGSTSRRVRPRIQFNPFGGGGAMVFGFGPPGEVHGNTGDYAWGPNGLDNVISQLLANLEDNGPPPAEQEKIAALPTVVPSEDQLKTCSDCSVCKEVFTIGERLVLLPCSHLYHNDCIMPWLKLHDTCPTCRYSINAGRVLD